MSLAPFCHSHHVNAAFPHGGRFTQSKPVTAPEGAAKLVQESGLLVRAIHDRHRIQMHPLVENCRVDAAEVHVRVKITLHELAGIERWHLTVVSTLDLVAKHKRDTGGTMIRSGSVIAHAAAELREDEHDHIVRPVMWPEVRDEDFVMHSHVFTLRGVLWF